MKIRNKSDGTRVVVDPNFPSIEVAPGEVVDVADELGERLARQPDRWEQIDEVSCPVEGCDYSGTERGLTVHARSHDEES